MTLSALCLIAFAVGAASPTDNPVRVVAPGRLLVGDASLPLYLSQDWSMPLPGVTRAVVVLHGRRRNANVYYRTAMKALAAAGPRGRGSLMIAPQFLATMDTEAWGLPDVLHWSQEGWEAGDPAEGPDDASSFAALDAVLARLADKRLFPGVRMVVIAGHSEGGQMAQRYAIASHAAAALVAAGIAVRYVVANPSSYAYFDATRPVPPVATSCPRFNDWKYGMAHRPPYLVDPAPQMLEANYAAQDVTYLVGELDTNPAHPALDRSCMAEAEGATRYERAHNYYAALRARDGEQLRHRLIDVPGVGHDGDAMFTSPAGLAALFGP